MIFGKKHKFFEFVLSVDNALTALTNKYEWMKILHPVGAEDYLHFLVNFVSAIHLLPTCRSRTQSNPTVKIIV